MSETVLVTIISAFTFLIGSALASVLVYRIAIKKVPKELKVLDTQETSNLAHMLNEATQATLSQNIALIAERKDFENRIDQLEAHRDVRAREIYTLQQNFEAQNRDYAKKMQELHDTIVVLQTQVDDGSEKYEKLKKTTLRLYQALKDANVPIPDIDAELIDTLDRIKPIKSVK